MKKKIAGVIKILCLTLAFFSYTYFMLGNKPGLTLMIKRLVQAQHIEIIEQVPIPNKKEVVIFKDLDKDEYGSSSRFMENCLHSFYKPEGMEDKVGKCGLRHIANGINATKVLAMHHVEGDKYYIFALTENPEIKYIALGKKQGEWDQKTLDKISKNGIKMRTPSYEVQSLYNGYSSFIGDLQKEEREKVILGLDDKGNIVTQTSVSLMEQYLSVARDN